MSFGLPDKPRDEDYGVNDDAGEWSPEPFLDSLGDQPVTLEELVAYLEEMDILEANSLQSGDMYLPVDVLVERVKERRGK